jgi:Ni2+-binding GTPase involved in maturation of urease and hydrogenase
VQKLENYMQERFLVSGKAGSGKTHLVLEEIKVKSLILTNDSISSSLSIK